MDAQRGHVFATVIEARTNRVLEPATSDSPQALIDGWSARLTGRRCIFIGDAVARDAAAVGRDARWQTRTPGALAPQIARLGRERAERGEAGPPHKLEPIYVRRPDAEIERDHRRRLKAGPERNVASEGGER
jgi:tRNA A37 threonylcarbamoyladenosine modification protein TsaB